VTAERVHGASVLDRLPSALPSLWRTKKYFFSLLLPMLALSSSTTDTEALLHDFNLYERHQPKKAREREARAAHVEKPLFHDVGSPAALYWNKGDRKITVGAL
jgi:hypothetical protein